MKKTIYYSPDDIVTGGVSTVSAVSTATTLPELIPYAHVDLVNNTGTMQTVDLVLNVPAGSMLDINGLQVSGLMQTTCGCSYRTCSIGITLAAGTDVLTLLSVPILKTLLTGAQLIMIEINDNNPGGRPKGKTLVSLPA